MRIAAYVPGMGNPWKLTLGQWRACLSRIEELKADMERPSNPALIRLTRKMRNG